MPLLDSLRTHPRLVTLAWIGVAIPLASTAASVTASPYWGLIAVGFGCVAVLTFVQHPSAAYPVWYAAMWLVFGWILTLRSGAALGISSVFIPWDLAVRLLFFFTWAPFLLALPLALVRGWDAVRNRPPAPEGA